MSRKLTGVSTVRITPSIRFLRWFTALFLFSAPALLAQREIYIEPLQSVEIFKTPIITASFSKNAIAVSTTDKVVQFLDPATLQKRLALSGLAAPVGIHSFTPGGQAFVTAGYDGKLILWDPAGGAATKVLLEQRPIFTALALPRESMALVASEDRTLRVIDLQTTNELGSLPVFADEITEMAVQPDGKTFAVGLANGDVKVFTIAGLTLVQTLQQSKERVISVQFSADGKYLFAGTISGAINIWDTQTWALKTKISEQKGPITAFAFDPRVRWVASASADTTIKIFDLSSFGRVKTIAGTEGYATCLAFLNERTLFAGTSRGVAKTWTVLPTNPDTIKPSIFVQEPRVPADEPMLKTTAQELDIRGVVCDDVGVIAATVNGAGALFTEVPPGDTTAIPRGQRAKRFAAHVRLDSLGRNDFEIIASDKAGHVVRRLTSLIRLRPDEAVEIASPLNNAVVDAVSVPVRFTSWFDVARYSIAVNLVDIITDAVPAAGRAGDLVNDEIPLVVGDNQVQFTVTGTHGERFSKSLSVTRKILGAAASNAPQRSGKRRIGTGPQAWAVVVGISQYGNSGIPGLKYADRDAEAFADFLRRPEGGGYDSEHLRVILNKDATLANIKDALINFLGQAIDTDLVIIYFAGHGMPEPSRPQNTYLLTYDTDPNILGTTAFPMWQIQDVLGRYINAKRIVVFSDACHSGAISVNFATRGLGVAENNLVNQYLTDLAKSKEGTVVFTASAAGEVSQEFPDLGHGVFTYYLLEGLQGRADYNNDYVITINEIMQYVEEQVKRKTKGAQNPTRSQTTYDKELTIATIAH